MEVLTERFGFIVSCFRTPWFGSLEMAQNSIDIILYINGEDDKDQPLIFFVFPPNFQPMSGALGSTPGLSWRRLLALARPGLYCSVWAGTPVKVGGFTNKQWGIYLTWLNSTKKWWSNGDIIWYDGIYIYIQHYTTNLIWFWVCLIMFSVHLEIMINQWMEWGTVPDFQICPDRKEGLGLEWKKMVDIES